MLLGDPTKLRQVFINLLSNALKFTNHGKVSASSSLRNISENTVTIYFEIRDSGIGMSKEQIKRIFEPFTQADISTTRKFGGTGLGLSITKEIINLMGGVLSVESMLGVGSKFSFELTFETTEVADNTTIDMVSEKIEKPLFEGDVLICEDNNMNQKVICDHLARVGLNTFVTANGKEGVEAVQNRINLGDKPFDLIFMDIHMPVMNGYDAASKIHEMNTGTPIIALTANVMSNDKEMYLQCGMREYVGKPFTSLELWSCLLRYLEPVAGYAANEPPVDNRNDKNILKRLKVMFVEDNGDKLAEITTAINDGDSTLAHRLAHSLKSNAGLIGEKGLQKAAAEVENLLKNGVIPVDSDPINLLKAELIGVLDKLRPLLSDSAVTANAPAMSDEQIKALLEKLEPMLKSKTPDCVELVDEIRGLPDSDELIQQIEEYNFRAALKIFTELKTKWM
jgi:CheY-like chemotaxis protein